MSKNKRHFNSETGLNNQENSETTPKLEFPGNEPVWRGWVIRPEGAGWRLMEVCLPQSVMELYATSTYTPADTKQMTVAKIEIRAADPALVRVPWSTDPNAPSPWA
jgi:hypothetical protein